MKSNYVFKGWIKGSSYNPEWHVAVDGEVEASNASEALKKGKARFHSPVDRDKWRIFREVVPSSKRSKRK